MRTTLLSALLGSLLLLAACCDECSTCNTGSKTRPTPPTVAAAWRGAGDTIELSVWEMTCPGCVKNVETRVSGIEGVVSAKADQETSLLTVKIKDAASRDALVAKIRDAVHAEKKIVLGEDKAPGA
jgi:copper chaperone CopZ